MARVHPKPAWLVTDSMKVLQVSTSLAGRACYVWQHSQGPFTVQPIVMIMVQPPRWLHHVMLSTTSHL